MTIGLNVDGIISEVGTSEFFHAFFSTIHSNLETGVWGSAYPTILGKLYQGALGPEDAGVALIELSEIKIKLSKLPVSSVVWDSENLELKPPWGDEISDEITDLSNYFVTSTGRDLIETIEECFEYMSSENVRIEIVNY